MNIDNTAASEVAPERGIGDNSHNISLVEMLVSELADEQKRADELLLQAGAARLETPGDAGKVADLILMLRVLERRLESRRDARKQSYLADMRIIDATFAAMITPLSKARTGEGSLTERLEAWRKENPDILPLTTIASVGSRRKSGLEIDDLEATVAWLLEHRREQLMQAARTIIGPIVRHDGVDAKNPIAIPGVRREIETRAQVR